MDRFGLKHVTRGLGAVTAMAGLALATSVAHAAEGHSSETIDTVATVLAWVVICVAPIIGITVFLMVHVLPEKIAHKRNHPQTAAIQAVCLLSLVFGGLLWPIAWIWAYSKPVMHKLAYGTDKLHPDESETPEAAEHGTDLGLQITRLRGEMDRLAAAGGAPPELAAIRDQLAALEPRLAATDGGAR